MIQRSWSARILVCVLIFSSAPSFARARDSETQVRDVVVIGAGAAGLVAADMLRRAGVSFVLLEKDQRSGGRIYSRPDADTSLGLILDEGANLINSTDKVALRLLKKFEIPYVRRMKHERDSMNYFLGGRVYSQGEMEELLFSQNSGALKKMAADQKALIVKHDEQTQKRFINSSIDDYLREAGVDRNLHLLLESFFWSEYGQSLQDLNVLVLFDYFHIDLKKWHFKLIPNTDEAYTIPGGAGQIAVRLEQRNHEFIQYGHRVSRIESQDDGSVDVHAIATDGEEVYRARNIIFAAPLHSLRKIWISVDGMSPQALNEARAVTYARGTKLHLKFGPGFHKLYKFPGILTTDTGEQIWISSFGQNGAGLLTVLSGPIAQDEAVLQAEANRVLAIIEKAAPGVSALYAGVERSDAPMSYSGSMKPGEEPELEINEGAPNWLTIGEASGRELRGYLEGALRSAEKGTERLIRRLQKQKSKCEDELSPKRKKRA